MEAAHIHWRACSHYRDRGLTLSGNKNGDTLLLRAVPSDIPASGRPDFRGREEAPHVGSALFGVWSEEAHPAPLGPAPPQRPRGHAGVGQALWIPGPPSPGEACFNPVLSNQRAPIFGRSLGKGGNVSIHQSGRLQTCAVYSQLLTVLRERHVAVMRNENAANNGLIFAREGWRLLRGLCPVHAASFHPAPLRRLCLWAFPPPVLPFKQCSRCNPSDSHEGYA